MKISDPKNIGKPCPTCRVPISETTQRAVFKTIKENAILSQKKARERGNKLGRPKKRDDELIYKLRMQGWSYSKIAASTQVSVATVYKSLKKTEGE